MPAYPLAPEHPFPTALNVVLQAYESLLGRYSPTDIMLAGDSAGGGLVCAALFAAREIGLAMPSAIACFSPWTDLCGAPDHEIQSRTCAMFFAEHVPLTAEAYLGNHDPSDPLASPLWGDFSGFPATLIQVSRTEMLFSDSTRLFERMSDSGVRVELSIYDDLPHGWQMLAPWLPNAGRALREAAQFLSGPPEAED